MQLHIHKHKLKFIFTLKLQSTMAISGHHTIFGNYFFCVMKVGWILEINKWHRLIDVQNTLKVSVLSKINPPLHLQQAFSYKMSYSESNVIFSTLLCLRANFLLFFKVNLLLSNAFLKIFQHAYFHPQNINFKIA